MFAVKSLRQIQTEVVEKEQEITEADEELQNVQNTATAEFRKIETKENEFVLNMVLTRHKVQEIEKEVNRNFILICQRKSFLFSRILSWNKMQWSYRKIKSI